MTYRVPYADISFALHSTLGVLDELSRAGFEIDRDTFDSILSGYGEFVEKAVAPLNLSGDKEGCTWSDGEVTTPQGYKQAYKDYVEAGWPALSAAEEHGGGGMPATVVIPTREMLTAASSAWSMFSGLSTAAYTALAANGTPEQQELYLPKIASGEWTGTMCLTEPQAGTDLGLLSTKAVPNGDGTYSITGNKIFISAGQHDLVDNIIHLVLARTPDAPAGTRGISLFVVPRNVINDDGSIGENNGVHCDGIEDKMGIHGSPTAVMRFEKAQGTLIGEENRGLPAMFVMMNSARIGTAVQGLGIASYAAQLALDYSRERIQSKAPKSIREANNRPAGSDPIILQPDVRRMLLEQKAWIGGARFLMYWLALQNDLANAEALSEEERDVAMGMVELLTPVAKAFITDRTVDVASLGMQVHGGAGFIHDYGAEMMLRDARILPIYEGTNGVQAMDLIGRKIMLDGAKRLTQFGGIVKEFVGTLPPELSAMGEAIEALSAKLEEVLTSVFTASAEDDVRPGASSVAVLNGLGYLTFGYFWARAAKAAVEATGDDPEEVRAQNLAVAKFYFEWLMPSGIAALERATDSTEILMDPAAIAY